MGRSECRNAHRGSLKREVNKHGRAWGQGNKNSSKGDYRGSLLSEENKK